MILGDYLIFSFEFLGIKLEITNLLISAFLYALIVLFLCIFYQKKGYVFKILNKMFLFTSDICEKNIGDKSYNPILFFIFFIIFTLNTLRCFCFPAINSFYIFPLIYSAIVFIIGISIGLKENGLLFFWNLAPSNVPLILKPFLMIIETIVLFTKPITLCARLFLNITVGHIVVHSLHEVAHSFGYLSFLALPIFILINFIEIGIGILQAYVFIIFSSLFISNCIGKH